MDITKQYVEALKEAEEEAQKKAEFEKLDTKDIEKMSDKELAVWHSKQTKDSPEDRLAVHIWAVRTAEKGGSKARKIAGIAIFVSAFALIIATCSWLFPHQKSALYQGQVELQEHVRNFSVDLKKFAQGYSGNNPNEQEYLNTTLIPEINSYKNKLYSEGIRSTNLEHLFDLSSSSQTSAAIQTNLIQMADELGKMARQLPDVQ